jgi:hypothetical protein
MNNHAIFIPMLVMMALTALVWFYMYARRIPAMFAVGKHAQIYASPGKIDELLPEEVNYSANNLKNLFELPVLFYALCLYLFVIGSVDTVYMGAAWAFVAFRAAHSVVHCTKNVVKLRFYLYAVAAIALWFMLGRALFYALSL